MSTKKILVIAGGLLLAGLLLGLTLLSGGSQYGPQSSAVGRDLSDAERAEQQSLIRRSGNNEPAARLSAPETPPADDTTAPAPAVAKNRSRKPTVAPKRDPKTNEAVKAAAPPSSAIPVVKRRAPFARDSNGG